MNWTPPPLSDLPIWPEHGRVAVDIETCDPLMGSIGISVRHGGFIAGVAFAIEGGPSHYLPIAHGGGGNYAEKELPLLYLRDQAANFKGEIVGANLQYDLDYLAEEGIVFRNARFLDVQVAGPLLATGEEMHWDGRLFDMNLGAIAGRMGFQGKREDEINRFAEQHGLHPKKDLWKMPASVVAAYAIGDVDLPLKIMAKQEQKLYRWGQEDLDTVPEGRTIWDLFKLESDLLPVLVKMRRRGVRVDMDKMDQIASEALKIQKEAMRKLTTISGVEVNYDDVMKAAALAPALEKAGLKVGRTPTGLPQITAPWLREQNNDAAKALIEARKYAKVRTTFITSIERHSVTRNGETRVHPTFNQLRSSSEDGDPKGAAFGRLSSSNMNIQQQPARDDVIGPLWRSLYLPDEGGIWACNDYSQQEPRWVAHFGELIGAQGADVIAGRYRDDPKTDNHSMMAELTGLKRTDAKQIFLGKLYGMGGAKYCHSVGLPTITVVRDPRRKKWTVYEVGTPEAEQLAKEVKDLRPFEMAGPEGAAQLRQFDQRVPYVRGLSKATEDAVVRRGFIRTILGRRCYFKREKSGRGYYKAYVALNRLIQGSSADQMKKAMVDLDKAGFRIQIQVHDEVDQTVSSATEAKEIAEIMLNAVNAVVPFVVDTEIGPDWGHLKEV
jgi:DNA polymerase I-like protein with 3'-5' exonuclease and polymerase domains